MFKLTFKYRGDEEVVVFLEMLVSLHAIISGEDEEDENKQTALLCIDILARYLAVGEHKKQFAKVTPAVIKNLTDAQKFVSLKPENHVKIQLLSSACLCIGTLTSNLKELILAQIPMFFPGLLSSFELQFASPMFSINDSSNKDENNEFVRDAYEILSQSTSTGMYAVVSTVPEFLSPYLDKLVTLIIRCWQISKFDNDLQENARKTGERIGDVLAVAVEPRLLHPSLCSAIVDLTHSGDESSLNAAQACLQILETSIEPMPQASVKQQLDSLCKFFSQTLDVRGYIDCDSLRYSNAQNGNATMGEENEQPKTEMSLRKFEDQLVKTLLTFVMLLSEKQLRILFDDLCNVFWVSDTSDLKQNENPLNPGAVLGKKKRKNFSSQNGNGKIKKRTSVSRQSRAAIFYLFLSKLSERLSGIFVPFLDKVFSDLVMDLSSSFPDDKTKLSEFWIVRERSLEALGHFFTFASGTQSTDGSGYMNKSQFDQVMTPLVNQLDLSVFMHSNADEGQVKSNVNGKRKRQNIADNNSEIIQHYSAYISEHVKPCIVKLVLSQADSNSWQTLHHAILEFTRHELSAVRSATLLVIRTLFEQIGDEYIVLLADTLPGLAELLEDEDEHVRALAHKTANKLEQLSGEDLKQLLRS